MIQERGAVADGLRQGMMRPAASARQISRAQPGAVAPPPQRAAEASARYGRAGPAAGGGPAACWLGIGR
jgi:hypothetical protein